MKAIEQIWESGVRKAGLPPLLVPADITVLGRLSPRSLTVYGHNFRILSGSRPFVRGVNLRKSL